MFESQPCHHLLPQSQSFQPFGWGSEFLTDLVVIAKPQPDPLVFGYLSEAIALAPITFPIQDRMRLPPHQLLPVGDQNLCLR